VPTDLVPDVLLAVGYLDDAAVIGWAMAAVAGEIEAFRRWSALQEGALGDCPDSGARR
jgi:uncharacterized membrane protein YkvA (DUF1232 family)